MTYILKPKSQEEEEQRNQPNQQPMMGTASAGSTLSQVAPSQPSAQPAQPSTIGRKFPLMGKYLEANKGLGAGMAGAIGGRINDYANQAQGAISHAQKTFSAAVDKGTGRFTPPTVGSTTIVSKNQVGGKPSATTTMPGGGSLSPIYNDQGQLIGNASPAYADPNYNGPLKQTITYGGPSSLQDMSEYNAALRSIRQGSDMAGAARTTGGTRELLADVYAGRGSYGGGLGRLDAALVSQANNPALSQASDRFPLLSQALKDATGLSLAQADEARRKTDDAEKLRQTTWADIETEDQHIRDEVAKQGPKRTIDYNPGVVDHRNGLGVPPPPPPRTQPPIVWGRPPVYEPPKRKPNPYIFTGKR